MTEFLAPVAKRFPSNSSEEPEVAAEDCTVIKTRDADSVKGQAEVPKVPVSISTIPLELQEEVRS